MSTPTSAPVAGDRSDAIAGDRRDSPAPAPTTIRKALSFDVGAAWELNPKVALRPEPFGALLYHFGTRKLSFLKNLTVVGIVQSLAAHDSAEQAFVAAGIGTAERPLYLQALSALADSGMIVRR
ncbi:mycofactocin biosynthesis chaperone MftB [Gordonia sp. NPDC003950]